MCINVAVMTVISVSVLEMHHKLSFVIIIVNWQWWTLDNWEQCVMTSNMDRKVLQMCLWEHLLILAYTWISVALFVMWIRCCRTCLVLQNFDNRSTASRMYVQKWHSLLVNSLWQFLYSVSEGMHGSAWCQHWLALNMSGELFTMKWYILCTASVCCWSTFI